MSYLDFYKLTAEPFSNAPVTRFYYSSRQHERAQQKIRYAIENMKGLGVVIGEIGAGKTTLARRVLDSLPDEQYHAAMMVIVHSGITADWLLKQIAIQLGVRNPAEQKLPLLSQVYRRLQQITQEGRKAVILIDEAQMLKTRELMEEFRGLLNLEVPGRKLITFVFFGLAELSEVLKIDEPLRNRVAVRCQLGPLDLEDLTSYVKHRLTIAGCPHNLFSPEALEHIHRYSKGVPRLINTICDNCLFEGFIAKAGTISGDIAEQVSLELGLEIHPPQAAMQQPGVIPGYPMPQAPGPGYPSEHDRITASYPAMQTAPQAAHPAAMQPAHQPPMPPQPSFQYSTPTTAASWQQAPAPHPHSPATRPDMPPVPPPATPAKQDHRSMLGSILRDGLKERATSTTMQAQAPTEPGSTTQPMITPQPMNQEPSLGEQLLQPPMPVAEVTHQAHTPQSDEEAASYETLDDELIVIEEIDAEPVQDEESPQDTIAEAGEEDMEILDEIDVEPIQDTASTSQAPAQLSSSDLELEPDDDVDEDEHSDTGPAELDPSDAIEVDEDDEEPEEEIELLEEVTDEEPDSKEDDDIVRIAPAGLFNNDAPLPTGTHKKAEHDDEGVIELSDKEQITPGVRSRIQPSGFQSEETAPMPFMAGPSDSGSIEHLRDTDVPDFLEQMIESHQPKTQAMPSANKQETQELTSDRTPKPSAATIDGLPTVPSEPVQPKPNQTAAPIPGPNDSSNAIQQALQSESLEQFEQNLQSHVHGESSNPTEPIGTPSERFRAAAAELDDMDGEGMAQDGIKETKRFEQLRETQPDLNWNELAKDLDPQRPRKSLEEIIREFGGLDGEPDNK